jgi:hypothetical protein
MFAFKRSVPLAVAGVAVAAALAAGPALAAQQSPARPAALTQRSALSKRSALIQPSAAQDSAAARDSAAAKDGVAAKDSAAAKGDWTISRGGRVVAVALGAVVRDTTADKTALCYQSTMRLSLKSGKKLAGSDAGSLTSAGFGQCTLPHGIPLKVTLAGFPWHVNLQSYNAAKGITTGTLTGMHLGITTAVHVLGFTFTCSALADGTGADTHTGSLAADYSNRTGVLTAKATGGNLRLYDVKNCNGLIKDGDKITLGASYTVSPAQKITGP